MLKTRIIPCLTVKSERLVKSVQFGQHRNIGSYVGAVRVFNARDVDELIFLDLDARTRGVQKWLLAEVTKECFMPVTLGGGVKSVDDVQELLSIGADKVAINSAAIDTPELVDQAAKRYGNQCVVISIDVRLENNEHMVFSNGGQLDCKREVTMWAKEVEARGAGEILLNSIDRDGTMKGYDLELVRKVSAAVRIPVIALGGAGKSEDCVDAIHAGASAVSLASIFQYTQTTPALIKTVLHDAGVLVRPAVI